MSLEEHYTTRWAAEQRPLGSSMASAPALYRNIELELDNNRLNGTCIPLHTQSGLLDFTSCDFVSFGSSGSLRVEFLKELQRNPDFSVGSCSTRLLSGNTVYQEELERDLAAFSKCESALIVQSGGMANNSIFATIPRPGDIILFDELCHTTTLGGFRASMALEQKSFRHNNVDAFIDALSEIKDTNSLIRNGDRTVFVAVEGYYSMDGDICPLSELVDAAKEILPNGSAQFVVDEAHSFGVIGPHGGGLVAALGLEKEIAIRMHIFGKAMASHGAVILSNNTIRRALINKDRVIMTTTAPSFLQLASMRAGLTLSKTAEAEQARASLQSITKYFLATLHSNATFTRASAKGIINMPLHADQDWDNQPFISQICPVWTRKKYARYLSFHLLRAGISAYSIVFPIVPKGKERVRLVMHARTTEKEVQRLVNALCSFALEILDLEAHGEKGLLPSAAKEAHVLIEKTKDSSLI